MGGENISRVREVSKGEREGSVCVWQVGMQDVDKLQDKLLYKRLLHSA